MWKKVMTVAISVLSLGATPAIAPITWNGYRLEIPHANLVQGEAGLLRIKLSAGQGLPPLKVTFLHQDLSQGQVKGRPDLVYYMLPVEYHTKPGTYTLKIEDISAGAVKNVPIRVVAGHYPKEKLSVNPKYTKLPPEDEARAAREAAMIAKLYANYQPFDETIRTLKDPLNSSITSTFGNQRIFNGEVTSFHNGIDFRAQVGLPIHAAAEGKILIAENLFYSGNHVSIDHGAGVVTTYSHLSKITVKVGEKVKQGDVIGLTGSTGRVTGPHLHWVVKLDAINVNPIQAQKLLKDL